MKEASKAAREAAEEIQASYGGGNVSYIRKDAAIIDRAIESEVAKYKGLVEALRKIKQRGTPRPEDEDLDAYEAGDAEEAAYRQGLSEMASIAQEALRQIG